MTETRPTTPETLYLEVTNRCNSLCQTCVRTFDLAEPEADFSLESVKRLLSSLPPGGAPKRVVLNGVGEALLHHDLVAIVGLFHQLGATVLFNTNAVTLSPALTLALAHAGLQALRISIDGASAKTYEALRGIPALERVVRNTSEAILALAEHNLTTPQVSIWFTATRQNIAELPDMVRLTHRVGARELYFQRLVFRDGESGFGAAHHKHSLLRGDVRLTQQRAIAEARTLAAELGIRLSGAGNASDPEQVLTSQAGDRPWSGCRRPRSSTYVTANGNVLPCCIAPFSTTDYASITLGNLSEASLEQVWNGEVYQEFRKRFDSDNPPDCCRRCGLDWSL